MLHHSSSLRASSPLTRPNRRACSQAITVVKWHQGRKHSIMVVKWYQGRRSSITVVKSYQNNVHNYYKLITVFSVSNTAKGIIFPRFVSLCMIFRRVLYCFDVLTLTTTHTHTPKHAEKSVQFILHGYRTAKISSSLQKRRQPNEIEM